MDGADAPTRILILMSDTGGGHRASAQALVDAFDAQFPGRFECDVVDIWTERSQPLRLAHSAFALLYPICVHQFGVDCRSSLHGLSERR